MTIRNAAGAVINKTQLLALTSTVVDPPPVLTVSERIYQDYDPRAADGNTGTFEPARRLLMVPGQNTSAAFIDGLFLAATATSITPNTGAAAGGTPFIIKGTNLAGTVGVTFGGTAATAVKVVDNETVTGVTPAKTAGAYTVIVKDDSGDVSKPSFFTYS